MSLVTAKEILSKYFQNSDQFWTFLNKLNITQAEKEGLYYKWPMNETTFLEVMRPYLAQNVNPQFNYNSSSLASNSQVEYEADSSYLSQVPSIRVFFYCLYVMIFFTGISGNLLVCYVVLRNKAMQTVTNIFITNLAISDILLCLLAVPFTVLYLVSFQSWVFGKLMCHMLPAAQGVSVYISAFTLMSIAIDRYFVILYPFKPRMEFKTCIFIILTIWVSAIILTFPYGWFNVIIPYEGKTYCQEEWPSISSKYAFGFSTTILQFVIPFIIISFCYLKVCLKLKERTRHRPGAPSALREQLERERTRRTNRMLIAMVIIFGLAWLPLNLNNLIQDLYSPAEDWIYARVFFLLAHACAMSSTCYNPFLYAWLNENFRKEFKQVLPCYTMRNNSSSRNSINNNVNRANSQHNSQPVVPLRPHDIPKRSLNDYQLEMIPMKNLALNKPENNQIQELKKGEMKDEKKEEKEGGERNSGVPFANKERKQQTCIVNENMPQGASCNKQTVNNENVSSSNPKDICTTTTVNDLHSNDKCRKKEENVRKKKQDSTRIQMSPKNPKGANTDESCSTSTKTAAIYVPGTHSVQLKKITDQMIEETV